MPHARLHAMVFGSALFISSVVVLVKASQSPKAQATVEPDRPATPRPPPKTSGGTRVDEPETAQDPLSQARKYVLEAQKLYGGAQGKDNQQADLQQAKRYLVKARELLDGLPEDDPGAKQVRNDCTRTLNDVLKVLEL